MRAVASPEKQVQGDLASFSIFDITQTLLAGQKSASVTVESGIRRGFLAFENGQIVHATDDQLNSGEKAVYAIFAWRRGAFTIDFDAKRRERNVRAQTDFLLLEIARQLDEAAHEAGPGERTDEQIEQSVETRLGDSLKSKLTSIFKRVAERAEPARNRYTRHAFDGLLGPLLEKRGSAVFIRRGLQPRVKTADGFATLMDEVVDADEINGFLMASLSERDSAALRETKEVTTLYDGGPLGTFRVSVFEEEGAPTIVITPAFHEVPPIEEFGLGEAAEALCRITEGLVLVSGTIGSAKASLLGALVARHVDQRDKFAVLFAADQLHAFSVGRGFVMQRPRPAGADLARSVQAALDRGADLLGVDPVSGPAEIRTLLEVGATGRLVIGSMQALSLADAVAGLRAVTEEQPRERVLRLLSDALRAVVWLPPRRPMETPLAERLLIGEKEQALLRKGDFDSLMLRQLAGG